MKNLKILKLANNLLGPALALLSIAGCREKTVESTALVGNVASTASEDVIIGLQPSDNAKNLDLFVAELTKKLGKKVIVNVSKDYTELVDSFRKGSVDFAFFSPLNLIDAEKTAMPKVLLKKVYDATEFYYSAIVVRKDSAFKSVKDLKGKKVVFVDPKSTSGYLYPQVLLKKAGLTLSDVKFEFSGTHRASMLLLDEKKADAVAVWASEPELDSGAWTDEQFATVGKKKFKVIAYSDPIPNDAFVVRKEFYEKEPSLVLLVMEKMIELGEEPDNILKKVFDVARLSTATSRHYDSVRQMNEVLSQEQKVEK